jgi:hypothetical protein
MVSLPCVLCGDAQPGIGSACIFEMLALAFENGCRTSTIFAINWTAAVEKSFVVLLPKDRKAL